MLVWKVFLKSVHHINKVLFDGGSVDSFPNHILSGA
jgi:hypothetical protein